MRQVNAHCDHSNNTCIGLAELLLGMGDSLSLEQYMYVRGYAGCEGLCTHPLHVYMHMYAPHDIFCSVNIAPHSPDHIETLAYIA